jgi:hypothetical protein
VTFNIAPIAAGLPPPEGSSGAMAKADAVIAKLAAINIAKRPSRMKPFLDLSELFGLTIQSTKKRANLKIVGGCLEI